MKVSEYFAKKLVEYGATDAFGIPGGVILELIYELAANENFCVHLNYHEQASAYAACGYAQSTGKIGVAYATKGPGFTNMMTAIAEAYYDSLPVLFVTAHSQSILNKKLRIENEQEVNHIEFVKSMTKYAKRIDSLDQVIGSIEIALIEATSGRKGPVVLDFATQILKSELDGNINSFFYSNIRNNLIIDSCIEEIKTSLSEAKRPVMLVGDGIRFQNIEENFKKLTRLLDIPILSSRFSQDILCQNKNYYGYIGSHGLRYSNFILSKTDCIIAIGNRLAFPLESKSFSNIIYKAKIIRIDVDENELERFIPNSVSFCIEAKKIINELLLNRVAYQKNEWMHVCEVLKENLFDADVNDGISIIAEIISNLELDDLVVCDIGNNELLTSRAYALSGNGRKLLHSKTFKTVGSAIGKAIGAYYANHKRVMCIMGDQGIQFNIQELQFISNNKLPIVVLICNNHASEMLRDSEIKQGYSFFLHTTIRSGYSHPDYKKIAYAYNIDYIEINNIKQVNSNIFKQIPQIIELFLNKDSEIVQFLPKGNPCQKFVPELEETIYMHLDNL